jgi:hypothetical protein
MGYSTIRRTGESPHGASGKSFARICPEAGSPDASRRITDAGLTEGGLREGTVHAVAQPQSLRLVQLIRGQDHFALCFV